MVAQQGCRTCSACLIFLVSCGDVVFFTYGIFVVILMGLHRVSVPFVCAVFATFEGDR